MGVRRVASSVLPTAHGEFNVLGYEAKIGAVENSYVVLVKGDLSAASAPLVRIQSQCLTGDVFASTRCDCGEQLTFAMQTIQKEGRGVIIYHPEEGRGIGLLNKLRAYELQDQGIDTVEANQRLGFDADQRDYSPCAEIVNDLGISRVRLLSNNPGKLKALEDAGVRVVERISIEVPPRCSNKNYLKTKKEKPGSPVEQGMNSRAIESSPVWRKSMTTLHRRGGGGRCKLGSAVLGLIWIVFVAACSSPEPKELSFRVPDSVVAGQVAPGFVVEDRAGKVHRLSDFQGKVVLVNFWATWCPPCIEEMPSMESLHKELDETQLAILGAQCG